MSNATRVARAWRQATPAAIHPELDDAGRPKSRGHLDATITDLLELVARYDGRPPAELTILDYGAGTGRVALDLIRHFDKVTLADTNPAFLELAGSLLVDRTKFDLLLVEPIPNTLPTVDVVLCVNVLLHLDPATIAALLEVFGAASASGLVFVQIPVYSTATRTSHWTGVNTMTPTTLRGLAASAGLELLEVHSNPGRYAPRSGGGPNHHRLHALRRRA